LDDIHRTILNRLMSGWQGAEPAGTAGVAHLNELATAAGTDPDNARGALLLLESLGYVEGVHSLGGDPTIAYKGIDEPNGRSDGPEGDAARIADPAYCITDWGRRAVLAEAASEGEGATG
jgi:hypothetical protein